ncbi:hypothetical protein SAMN05661008_01313 [Alkalithermobacter thermoalcaliphilus JW-YL-7 = DSM 7308]|uniref:Uncharacterized protein n=1 Tax=Alkalithermobacter thermoalcaliphilus JW-YL-7 = DSM 7308 TaxID=1121328 RepID=A0A150FRA8_CLOPD|nr:hypothetical protein JWYL7_1183 [[Clostridium] paradoxum JW-YL-7 = DSM 7308]SHL01989.1 hypothetical protein SAMN05661008_01313 [[Clostridium] paradoxum JW-YL-7 = DSM 7308]
MKKIICILSLLLLINIFTLAFRSYSNIIPIGIVDSYLNSENVYEKQQLKKQIITSILNATGYDKWLEYVDYIDMKIYKNINDSDKKEEILFALNLSKDSALIAIYEKLNNTTYLYKNKITNLVPVKNVTFLNNFLAIEQVIDERFGAFFIDNFIQIYLYDDNVYKSVFKQSVDYEEIYKAIWVDKNAPDNLWNKTKIVASIDYLDEDPFKILYIVTTSRYKAESASFPKDENFKKESEKTEKHLYVWDQQRKSFVLKEKTDIKKEQPKI